MTSFIKEKLNKSDGQTIIHKYNVAANITVYHIRAKSDLSVLSVPYGRTDPNYKKASLK